MLYQELEPDVMEGSDVSRWMSNAHKAPELLMAGKAQMSVDVYALGIISEWGGFRQQQFCSGGVAYGGRYD